MGTASPLPNGCKNIIIIIIIILLCVIREKFDLENFQPDKFFFFLKILIISRRI